MSVLQKTLKGAKVAHFKNTENCESTPMPLPKEVAFRCRSLWARPCNPLVKKGDAVKVGTMIGDSEAFLSAPIPFERLGDGLGGRGDRDGHPAPRCPGRNHPDRRGAGGR